MKVTLVNPPTLLSFANLGTMKPTLPLGLAYVAAAARRAGHEVRVVDAIAIAPYETWRNGVLLRIGAGTEQIVRSIPADTQVIGIGCVFSFLWPFVRGLIHELRTAFPSATIVCGGEHFSSMPERCLEEAPIDWVVLGEGEETFTDLLAALESGTVDAERIPGLAWRENGACRRSARRTRVRAIDEIAWPAWELFEPEVYNANDFALGMRLGFAMPILATRGCPYQCTFCTSPQMWTTRWYARDPAQVVDEMETYHRRYGAVSFPFHDLTAVIKRHWIEQFCREILSRGLKIHWQLPTGTRCEAFDEDLARLMVQSGCRYLSFAPESGSASLRERIKKRLKEESLVRAVRAAVSAGMHVTCFFIVGLPSETEADLRETEALARTVAREGVGDISCHYFYPAPGTELYRQLGEQGKLRRDDDELMSALLYTGLLLEERRNYNEHLSARRLSLWRYRIFAAFYGTRFASRPRAALQLGWNILRGRETNKLESFARDFRMKLTARRRGRQRPDSATGLQT